MARTVEQTRGPAATAAPRPAEGNGRAEAPPTISRPKSGVRRLILPVLAIVLVATGGFGFLYYQQIDAYVSTDNALVTGNLIHVGPTSAAHVRSVNVQVGDRVERNQTLASVVIASGQTQALRSTLDGVVLARHANPGDTLAAGRPVVSVLDGDELWVQAQVEETQVGRLRPGQPVDVTVEALGRTIQGRLHSIGSGSTAALAPTSSSPTNPVRTRPLVPVRIAVDPGEAALLYGGQAFVKIFVR